MLKSNNLSAPPVIFSARKTSVPEPPKVDRSITEFLADIDNFLTVHEKEVKNLLRVPNNLTPVHQKMENDSFKSVYAINLAATKMIFHALLEKGIKIGFITGSRRNENDTKIFFEKLYNLPARSLENATFINYYNYSSKAKNYEKGHKVTLAKSEGIIDRTATILAVDDYPLCIDNFKKFNIKAIQCNAFPIPPQCLTKDGKQIEIDINNSYLQEIVDACDLPITLPVLEPEVNDIGVLSLSGNLISYYPKSVQLEQILANRTNFNNGAKITTILHHI